MSINSTLGKKIRERKDDWSSASLSEEHMVPLSVDIYSIHVLQTESGCFVDGFQKNCTVIASLLMWFLLASEVSLTKMPACSSVLQSKWMLHFGSNKVALGKLNSWFPSGAYWESIDDTRRSVAVGIHTLLSIRNPSDFILPLKLQRSEVTCIHHST